MNLALIGEENKCQEELSLIIKSCKNNSYILNRIAHVYACLNDGINCGKFLKLAASKGFSSWELTEIEEATSLLTCKDSRAYISGLAAVKRKASTILSEHSQLRSSVAANF